MAIAQPLLAEAPALEAVSLWDPLRRPLFRDRLIATFVSNTGGWMQATAGAWLMATLTASPLLVALMQTAGSLPVLLLGLPAGAMADLFDRRRLLLFWACWMCAVMGTLAALASFGVVGPWLLLAGTFLLGIGTAMNGPTWQSIVQELVPRRELPTAVSLNAAGFNLARAIGPAVAGLLLALFSDTLRGAATVFLIDAVALTGVIWVLARWKREATRASALPAERMIGSMRAGLRYAGFSPALRGILVSAGLLALGASALWSLLPIVTREHLRGGALGYGILTGSVGIGAVIAAVSLPRIRGKIAADRIVDAAVAGLGGALLMMAWVRSDWAVMAGLVVAGIAWTSIASSLNLAVQLSVPAWVQARTLGIYQMTFVGGTALGGVIWGTVAEHFGADTALTVAAASLAASLAWSRRSPLMAEAEADHTPAFRTGGLAQPAPQLVIEPHPEEGPVLVAVDFHIDPARADAFTAAVHRIRLLRLRSGASRWGVFRDPTDAGHFVETFLVDSWVEHLRLDERMTVAERAIRDAAWSFAADGKPPTQHRLVYACAGPPGSCPA